MRGTSSPLSARLGGSSLRTRPFAPGPVAPGRRDGTADAPCRPALPVLPSLARALPLASPGPPEGTRGETPRSPGLVRIVPRPSHVVGRSRRVCVRLLVSRSSHIVGRSEPSASSHASHGRPISWDALPTSPYGRSSHGRPTPVPHHGTTPPVVPGTGSQDTLSAPFQGSPGQPVSRTKLRTRHLSTTNARQCRRFVKILHEALSTLDSPTRLEVY